MKTPLKPGMEVAFLDCPNGASPVNVATVVRARGLGVLLQTERGHKFRIPRSDVLRVIPANDNR